VYTDKKTDILVLNLSAGFLARKLPWVENMLAKFFRFRCLITKAFGLKNLGNIFSKVLYKHKHTDTHTYTNKQLLRIIESKFKELQKQESFGTLPPCQKEALDYYRKHGIKDLFKTQSLEKTTKGEKK